MFYRTSEPHGLKRNPFKALVVPRPIGWASTISAKGVVNLAPFSFFNAVAESPPMVMLCCNGNHSEGGVKDTLANIKETGEFVINIATWDLREQMNATSANLPRSVDEMQAAGLAPAPSNLVKPPRVGASPVNLECVHLQTVALPSSNPAETNHTVFGRVVGIHISESIIDDGLIDMKRFKPIARLGYHDYAVVKDTFTMARPA
jgi:flavin reductase (DIM6/NTAB) family NADH-FMN oxidoreductase RutF